MPQGQRIENGSGAKGCDEAVNLGYFNKKPVQHAHDGPKAEHNEHGYRPWNAVNGLQADCQDVPEHDAVTHGQINAACRHGDHGSQ